MTTVFTSLDNNQSIAQRYSGHTVATIEAVKQYTTTVANKAVTNCQVAYSYKLDENDNSKLFQTTLTESIETNSCVESGRTIGSVFELRYDEGNPKLTISMQAWEESQHAQVVIRLAILGITLTFAFAGALLLIRGFIRHAKNQLTLKLKHDKV